jgi:hypothetical protein
VKRMIKVALLGLSLLVGMSGMVLAGPSYPVSARSMDMKMTEGTFKTKLAELTKLSKSIAKKQSNLLDAMQTSQDDLVAQFIDLMGDPTAATDPVAPTIPSTTTATPPTATNPSTAGTTPPSVTSATYNTDDQLSSFYFDTLMNIADQDPSIVDYFDQGVLDELSPLADKVLTLHAKAEKLSLTYDKLDQSYNNYVMQSKYVEALNVLFQQINLDKKLNDIYQSILSNQDEISAIISDGLTSQSDDESNSKDYGNHQNNNNHDDNNKKDRKHD